MKIKYFLLFILAALCLTACEKESSSNLPEPTPPSDSDNVNANSPLAGLTYVTDYSMPHLNPNNRYVEHSVIYNGKKILNYALEWDAAKKHSVWVAFSFDAETSLKKVSRPDKDPYAEDPELEAGASPIESDHRSDGFDKGHLVASNDRLFSREANNQTFYYTNLSPMMSDFNGGVWTTFEIQLQTWARSGSFDKLYVTKGGPKTDENGFTIRGLACPKYYFMAILAQKGNSYQAMAFIVEHRDDYGFDYEDMAPVEFIKERACSVDQLERQTGLDFFCNLPDTIENEVESLYNEADWDFKG